MKKIAPEWQTSIRGTSPLKFDVRAGDTPKSSIEIGTQHTTCAYGMRYLAYVARQKPEHA